MVKYRELAGTIDVTTSKYVVDSRRRWPRNWSSAVSCHYRDNAKHFRWYYLKIQAYNLTDNCPHRYHFFQLAKTSAYLARKIDGIKKYSSLYSFAIRIYKWVIHYVVAAIKLRRMRLDQQNNVACTLGECSTSAAKSSSPGSKRLKMMLCLADVMHTVNTTWWLWKAIIT